MTPEVGDHVVVLAGCFRHRYGVVVDARGGWLGVQVMDADVGERVMYYQVGELAVRPRWME